MNDRHDRAIAIVGLGAILPDAATPASFWQNVCSKRYSITEVPPDRWSIADYYDADPAAPDKTYSKIGGWVRGFSLDWKRFHIPPRVATAMDEGQQWAVTIAADALADYGYPTRPLDLERTGVVLGTAMGGELHYLTNLRVMFPEYARALDGVGEFTDLPAAVRRAILSRWHDALDRSLPPVTEDSMPGELPNIVSGRVANVLNLRGPNFITDAACASSFAAIDSAIDLLTEHHCDAVISGGVDRNMGISSFVKFCKIGALSATGTRPFGDGADGFVMGEGAAAFVLKRLADAERDGDRVYAVIRGVGGSSDGKGKGITAPNPIGQKLAVTRAWRDAGLDPATAGLVEAHGTSTKVGDVVEVESLSEIFHGAGRGRIGLGSAKSNIGHLKAGAGAAGLLKAVFAVHFKVLPPTLNCERPNPSIDFPETPFFLVHDLAEWPRANGEPRRCGVSAYGFGGTNFHVVIEEHVPGMLTGPRRASASVPAAPGSAAVAPVGQRSTLRNPLRGIVALGASTPALLKTRLEAIIARVRNGDLPAVGPPDRAELSAHERLVIDFGARDELLDRLQKAERALAFDTAQAWKALQSQGVFRGSGPRLGKIAFLFPGQGSQYVNMGKELAAREPAVAAVFADADRTMERILGEPLTNFIFVDEQDQPSVERAEESLRQTAVTQPAVLTVDRAVERLLADFGVRPDYVMGHSLGEYAALVAAGVMPFADALEASAARGREMTRVSMEDNGWMAAIMAPLDEVRQTLEQIDGYVVVANVNGYSQSVIGGNSEAVAKAIEIFTAKGYQAFRLPVSHAFHTRIVAPAAGPLRLVLDRLRISAPSLPLVANVTGDMYPQTIEEIKDILAQQIASPVQWVKGLETLYAAGVRTFVEVGPKKALKGLVDDVLGGKPDVVSLHTNHPKPGALPTFNQAICGLYAAGWGLDPAAGLPTEITPPTSDQSAPAPRDPQAAGPAAPDRLPQLPPVPLTMPSDTASTAGGPVSRPVSPEVPVSVDVLAQAIAKALRHGTPQPRGADRNDPPRGSVVISGTGLGLPGAEKPVMDPSNVDRILRGEQFIDLLPERFRSQMARKHVTRVVKAEDGSGRFETIDDTAHVIKLAGRPGPFDLAEEYGVPAKLVEALDTTTQLAMAAGIDALREAGIPLVQTWRKTTTGKYLPDRWMLPESMRDDTGVIFASAFPGVDRFADEVKRYFLHEARLERRRMLEELRLYVRDSEALREVHRRLVELDEELAREPYAFDRRFIFRILAMGHSQFAEYIGARGPNAHANAACASTAQGIAIAEDWIRTGRCRRVVVIGADNATGEHLTEWIGSGFLATGAAATDDKVEEAAVPFDRRRHGTILGMGACALVVESQDAVEERGMRGIVELLASETRNSAFHGTRLDVAHVSASVESLVAAAERRFGISRQHIAPETVFMSHETYTPARGGSASAEIAALRSVFGASASEIVMANTKGFTGHPMGVGIEDVIAVKILEHGIVPPVPNFREVDPDLGPLTLSRGGRYPVKYALHLAAGFGSQIALTLTRRIPGGLDRVDNDALYQHWLDDVSGYDRAETEVVKRTLRVVSKGIPAHAPAPNRWAWGTEPIRRAPAPGDGTVVATRPAPLATRADDTRQPAAEAARAPKVEVAPKPDRRSEVVPAQVASTMPHVVAPPGAEGAVPAAAAAPQPPAPEVAPKGAPAPTAPPTAPSTGAVPADEVSQRVLGIVAEKTGYPPDMLEMDLDLEADLGVDTVKQAETFAAVREAYGITREDNLRLRDFPTLRHVVQFVLDRRPDLRPSPDGEGSALPAGAERAVPATVAASQPPAPAVVPETAPLPTAPTATPSGGAVPGDEVSQRVLGIVAEKTGYPPDMLEMDLDLEADLGVDTVKQAETFAAVREAYAIPREDDLRLRDFPTLRHVVQFVLDRRPDLRPSPDEGPPPGAPTPSGPEPPAPVIAAADAAPPVPAADVAAEPAVSPAHPVPVAVPGDEVSQRVMGIVADKTGYPPDMLEMDLDLEADLGVDTVKQAETFAAVREAYAIPREDDLRLRDFPTLRHVVQFVLDRRPDLRPSPDEGPPPGAPTPSGPELPAPVIAAADATPPPVAETEAVAEPVASPPDSSQPAADASLIVHEKPPVAPELAPAEPESVPAPRAEATVPAVPAHFPRRVVVPSLRPGLDLCKPTGVTLGLSSRVIVARDEGGVGDALEERLGARGVTVLSLPRGLDGDALDAQVDAWLRQGAVQGVYWLSALDAEPALDTMDLETFRDLGRQRVKRLFRVMRRLYESVAYHGTFLVVGTRLGGVHGHGVEGADAPLGGSVAGFAKAYKRERPDVTVKAVDFEVGAGAWGVADALIAETLSDPGTVEIGFRSGLRWTLALEERPADDGRPGMTLGPRSVFVVTGAAGSITSAIVADLAAASGGTFYLLDLVGAPSANDPYVTMLRADRDGLKLKLIEDAKARGERPTPVAIDKQLLAIERVAAARAAIEAVEAAGGTAYYRSVDLRDGPAVFDIVDEVRSRHGRIDVLIHAGGIEISHPLPDKPPEEFDRVFDIKADGFFSLIRAASGVPVGATVVFSSIAGRFGNAGQADYSAANALLCAMSRNLRKLWPETRAIAIDWTAWAGIGMAVRGSIPKVMELAGIEMLPPEVGIPTIRRELTAGSTADEIVVAGRLGVLAEAWDVNGGLDLSKVASWLSSREQPMLMVGLVSGATLEEGLTVSTMLDPKEQPFLYDHQIDGTPVLPGVMGIEAFAEVASVLCPGYAAAGVQDVEFRAPFKFFRMQPATLHLSASGRPDGDGTVLVRVVLKSVVQPKHELPPQERVHFVGTVRMTEVPPGRPSISFEPPPPGSFAITRDRVYQLYFHGPAYQVIEGVQLADGKVVALMADALPANAAPPNATSLVAPRLIELCFQAAGVLEIAAKEVMGLPTALRSVAVYRQPEEAAGRRLYALVGSRGAEAGFDAQVVDEQGHVYVDLSGYRTVTLVSGRSLETPGAPRS